MSCFPQSNSHGSISRLNMQSHWTGTRGTAQIMGANLSNSRRGRIFDLSKDGEEILRNDPSANSAGHTSWSSSCAIARREGTGGTGIGGLVEERKESFWIFRGVPNLKFFHATYEIHR